MKQLCTFDILYDLECPIPLQYSIFCTLRLQYIIYTYRYYETKDVNEDEDNNNKKNKKNIYLLECNCWDFSCIGATNYTP